jgi:hypothetical protein
MVNYETAGHGSRRSLPAPSITKRAPRCVGGNVAMFEVPHDTAEMARPRRRAWRMLRFSPAAAATWTIPASSRASSLDQDARARVIVARAIGEHFFSGGNIKGVFMEASPEHVSKLTWNIAAPAQASKLVAAATASGSASSDRSLAISASSPTPLNTPCPSRSLARSPALLARRGCRRRWVSTAPRTSSRARSVSPPSKPSTGGS